MKSPGPGARDRAREVSPPRLWLDGADPAEVARFVLCAPSGASRTVVGLTPEDLRRALDEAPRAQEGRAALIAPAPRLAPAERVIDDVIAALVETAARMWPSWHGRRNDGEPPTSPNPSVSARWARLAEACARRGAKPRPPGFAREVELAQLSLALHREGVALVVAPTRTPEPSEAGPLLHALEWIAHHADLPVVLALATAPAQDAAFDRALSSAMFVAPPRDPPPAPEPAEVAIFAPVLGEPHPLSEVERRVARALRADAELGALFAFNRIVRTSRGSTPRVDLLWESGALVVELDGYADHGARAAFARDRHRDYELTLSGYAVLRIANDEVMEDVEKAIEKIRDVVRSRATRMTGAAQ